MRYLYLLSAAAAAALLVFSACKGPKNTTATPVRGPYKHVATAFDTSSVFQRGFTGFHLMDPASGEVLVSRQADHYFTPASNTKILTLAACLAVLGDSIPTLEYILERREMYFRGMGDPTFLHDQFAHWQPAFAFMKKYGDGKTLAYEERTLDEPPLGPGWCWDDAAYAYQAERSAMPIYGNCFEVNYNPGTGRNEAKPSYFNRFRAFSGTRRAEDSNNWYIAPTDRPKQDYLPMKTSTDLLLGLLRDTLRLQNIAPIPYIALDVNQKPIAWRTLYSCPVDTVYKWMMYESDNLFAEQLLILAAQKHTGLFQQDTMIKVAKTQLFPPSATPPRWVDGSGLSRYNLVTPRYLCQVLQQLYQKHDRQRLFSLFPAGGSSGTVKDWYKGADGKPFVFAKTGSMSGVHCLSGYVVTRTGRTLVFSFMHNNFVGSNTAWKKEMERILNLVR